LKRALLPFRLELARDYHLQWEALDSWGLDELVDLVDEIHARSLDRADGRYAMKRR